MKTQAAVLHAMGAARPYTGSQPLIVEELELLPPGPGCVLVEIAAAGLCHSDLSVINGTRPRVMPMILGHEAAGIVREVGPAVVDLKPGDHVVFSYVPSCGRCLYCTSGRPALCEKGAAANIAGTLLDGRRYFVHGNGKPVNHLLGVAGFSRFTVAAAESLIKIDNDFPLQTAALFGCGVLTGVGAVINSAHVEPGATVAIFGLGGVGLSAVLGSVLAGAVRIIAVDTLPGKLAIAAGLGATDTLNAADTDVVAAIRDLSHGGVDYAFECSGIESVMQRAYESTRRNGMTVAVGLPSPEKHLKVPIVNLVVEERIVKGSYMGSAIPKRDIPRLIALHRSGRLPVERLLSGSVRLDRLNEAFDQLDRGDVIRQVLAFD